MSTMGSLRLTSRDLDELDKLSQATKGQNAQVKKYGYTAILNDVLQRTETTIELQKSTQARVASVALYLTGFFFLVFIVLAVEFGLTINAMEMSKESHIKEGALTDTGGQAVKVSSADFTLGSGGKMETGVSIGQSGQRRLAEEDSTTVGTAPVLSKYKLSSRIPNKYLQELEQFSVVGGDQQMMQVKVASFKRQPQEGAHCGSVVVFQTSQGKFTLDDANLFHNGQTMEADGFFGLDNRRLANMNLSAHGRRLIEEGAALADPSLHGDFRFLAGIKADEFVCEMGGIIGETLTVDPPKPPVIPYSYTVSVQGTCDFGDGLNACDSLVTDGAKPGVKQYANFSLMMHHEQVLLTNTHRVVVSYFGSQPLSRLIRITQIG